tara:strand:+ start:74 stop:892 length:819 start_codon:yes stop_codon:yes gene_type:complete
MKILITNEHLKKYLHSQEIKLGFIPTMGGLHDGHISLIKKAKDMNIKTIVSIFVNPKQFNNKNDFKKYPRNIVKDIKILRKINPDYLYLPNYNTIYSFKRKESIKINKFSQMLCGRFRDKHFNGVIDVIDRFIRILNPKYIFLGEKDYQQLILIKEYIKNKYKTIVVGSKIIREKNGLALSTRNFLLNKNDKIKASNVYRIIKFYKNKIKDFSKSTIYKKKILSELKKVNITKIDYLEFIDLKSYKKINSKTKKYRIFIAFYLKKIRLIDNI